MYVCADTLGGGRWPALRFDPISLVLAQRNGVEPPKKSAFLPRRLHHSRERCRSVDGTFLARLGEGVGGCLSPYLRRGRTGLVMAALRGRSTERASLYFYASAYHQSAFLWGSTPFLCARAKKWGGTGSRGHNPPPNKTAHPHPPPTSTSPLQKSGEKRPVYRPVALTRMVEPPG